MTHSTKNSTFLWLSLARQFASFRVQGTKIPNFKLEIRNNWALYSFCFIFSGLSCFVLAPALTSVWLHLLPHYLHTILQAIRLLLKLLKPPQIALFTLFRQLSNLKTPSGSPGLMNERYLKESLLGKNWFVNRWKMHILVLLY